MRKEAVIIGGLALIGAYLYFSQGEGEESNNQFLTGGGYIPKKTIPPVEQPVEPTSSNITYNIQFPELNIPQYTPSFTSEPSPETLTKKSKKKSKTRDIPVSPPPPPTGSSTMQNVLRAAEEKGAYKQSTGMKKELERAALAAGALHTVDYSQYGFSPASSDLLNKKSLYAEGGISSLKKYL